MPGTPAPSDQPRLVRPESTSQFSADIASQQTQQNEQTQLFGQSDALAPADSAASTTSAIPTFHVRHPSITPTRATPASGLHLETEGLPAATSPQGYFEIQKEPAAAGETPSASMGVPGRKSGLHSSLSAASLLSLSPGSVISSPALAAMTDITPLPSPILPGDSPGPWKRALAARPGSSGSISSIREELLPEQVGEVEPSQVQASPTKPKKGYGSLLTEAGEAGGAGAARRKMEAAHTRNRSISEYTPEELSNPRQRNVTMAGAQTMVGGGADHTAQPLHRESYLAEQRGLVAPHAHPSLHKVLLHTSTLPTPPPSNRSTTGSEADRERLLEEDVDIEYLTVRNAGQKLQYRPIRPLGQGTFSKVVLATSESLPSTKSLNEASEASLDPAQLVAIKIVEHGPAGGADEDRVELSLKREVELLQRIHHPSLIELLAFDFSPAAEALLVLSYSPGGDLFDLASARRDTLVPPVVQRIFAELVDAVGYLHSHLVVHRDLKLENVLLNLHVADLCALSTTSDIRKHPAPVITLTDLGLSRHIPPPPASPLLTTRCGSEDYAAPEILLAQPYDGRATDAWALGVLLYALMEGRLPFDAPPVRPGQRAPRGKSKAAHRIARCEWVWCRYGDEDGEWDPVAGKEWAGARECVEGLLKKVSRGRWSVEKLKADEWVKSGIQVEGGIKRTVKRGNDGDVEMSDTDIDAEYDAERKANELEARDSQGDEEES